MKNIIAIALIIASLIIFFTFIQPLYGEIGVLREDVALYDDTLQKADTIEKEIVEHNASIDRISSENLTKLEKMLPDNVDNVGLIIDINNVASNFGLAIRDINIEQPQEETQSEAEAAYSAEAYDSLNISFSVTSSYPNFVGFLKGLERSLRLVDVTSISFSPSETSANAYNFDLTVKTYWLK